jgi:hypothetical protein
MPGKLTQLTVAPSVLKKFDALAKASGHRPGKLIQTTVDSSVLKKFDALAKVCGHRRASYLRHLVEMHVLALTPSLAKITRSTIPLDYLNPMSGNSNQSRSRRR